MFKVFVLLFLLCWQFCEGAIFNKMCPSVVAGKSITDQRLNQARLRTGWRNQNQYWYCGGFHDHSDGSWNRKSMRRDREADRHIHLRFSVSNTGQWSNCVLDAPNDIPDLSTYYRGYILCWNRTMQWTQSH
ncbi:uncharacterized protein BX663DRAFT_501070 [Cokeromyces recurvatus]|uniref:uncharacterized protein n=1 Tax=Cokeromyces recurvatus TaxID=90255 RepID=UPI00221E73B6|nr:uncharacterized protein BX663DRAFT_501070 [Cokeromyces recurvatus]KAI7904929.1 hypothetical protein BX663DRAFT_501070 [Cokeromyces recurvatus]